MGEGDRTKGELLEELRDLRLRVAELEGQEKTHLERVRELEALQAEGLQTEEEIIRLERLHALEEMARGVAHNFNNVLVGVLGYAQIIEMQSSDPKAVQNACKIVENALRAKELVQRLSFSVRRGRCRTIGCLR